MNLLLLRHGPAEPKGDWRGNDTERPLSSVGRLQVADVAASLAKLCPQPELILTSPFLRARQTAQIMAGSLGIPTKVTTDDRLVPRFGRKQLGKLLRNHAGSRTMMLVGHEPDLSDLVCSLTGGGRVAIRKAAVAQVDLTDLKELKGRLVALIVPAAIGPEVEASRYDGL